MGAAVLVCVVLAICGAGVIVLTLHRARHVAPDFGEYFEKMDYVSDQEARLAQAVVPRLVGGLLGGIAGRLEGLVPAKYLANLDHQLAQAGLRGKRGAGEQLAIQVAAAMAGALLAFFIPPGTMISGPKAWVLLPLMGFFAPAARLKGAIKQREEAIFKDLPDIVDMLAIAVEAGSGFESALAIVCQNFKSPLTDELSIALHEMELGQPRKQALQEMRDRVDIDVVRTLILALLQADALGIPIGRVLKAQATEVRARRRAWAREKAAKLPIKIMFPLVLFIFPPILGLVLGPAALSFGKLGG
ncbi:MAG TPA: type II secretion system F family protein [Acidimicrobiales bacterium]|nr:type II secretion system F family protein [Acidimicrobiales bacterium]